MRRSAAARTQGKPGTLRHQPPSEQQDDAWACATPRSQASHHLVRHFCAAAGLRRVRGPGTPVHSDPALRITYAPDGSSVHMSVAIGDVAETEWPALTRVGGDRVWGQWRPRRRGVRMCNARSPSMCAGGLYGEGAG
jgi:hypothetical protein